MNGSQFLKAYTIKEVSRKINVPAGTIRQWEKDLKGLLIIPRTNQGARFYTETEMSLLLKIKEMRGKNLSKNMIADLLKKHLTETSQDFKEKSHEGFEMEETSLTVSSEVTEPTETTAVAEQVNLHGFIEAMEAYKETLINEVKSEIKATIRKELIPEVRQEISSGSLQTVKKLSTSILRSREKTKAELQGLSEKVSKHSSETLELLSEDIANASKGTSEQISSLELRISDSSEAASEEFKTLVHYISNASEVTNHEITSLIDTLNTDRKYYIETINDERELYLQEVKQREAAFQDMVEGFRLVAASKEKSWWKIWK